MDDRTFDESTALDWIQAIESGSSRRDQDIHPKLKEWIAKSAPANVLEIGCGQGISSDHIDLADRTYTGVEPSPWMVHRANELYASNLRRFVVGNAYDLPFPDAVFDAAFSVLVWHLLSNIEKATQELARVLKPDGQFLIITANPAGYGAWKHFYTELKMEGIRLEGKMKMSDGTVSQDILYLPPLPDLLNAFENAGLKVEETEAFRVSDKFKDQKLLLAIAGTNQK